jgi:hypothetical protein
MNTNHELSEGVRNLVTNCARIQPGESVLIVHENPHLGWYDEIVPKAVADEIRLIDIEPDFFAVGAPASGFDAELSEAVSRYDITLFFARIGDQNRFAAPLPGKRAVMCYARDATMLGSLYGRSSQHAFYALKKAINEILFGAELIEISCPLGTKISGPPPSNTALENEDVSIHRFPLGVPQPMESSHFSGRVSLMHYLTPTGSKVYAPPNLRLDETIHAVVEQGRIIYFEGNTKLVKRVQNHYQKVSDQFGIDADAVHSWHAGIHPACSYSGQAAQDPDRWSNTVFTNPRVLHFHTCGSYAPGEICWIVLDHTVSVDNTKLWDNGRLRLESFAQTRKCLDEWPELIPLFNHPSNSIGL